MHIVTGIINKQKNLYSCFDNADVVSCLVDWDFRVVPLKTVLVKRLV